MTAADLARIEAALGIVLPANYREMMLTRYAELRSARIGEIVFLDADDVIITNLTERKPNSGTAPAFPGWWKTFLLFGTNGGGDYFCLRLDADPKVWTIGSDAGINAEFVDNSLSQFIDKELAVYRDNET